MLARFFIDRPVFAWVISIVIVLVGLLAAATLPIAQYPEITPPTIQVACQFPGVSLDAAQVLVQNRVAQALPSLPDVVKATGVTVKKQSSSILLVVNLYSET